MAVVSPALADDLSLTRRPSRSSTYPSPSPSFGRISPPVPSRPSSSKRSFSPPPSSSASRRPKSFLARLRRSSTASDLPSSLHPRVKRASALPGALRRSLEENRVTRHGSIPSIPIVPEKVEDGDEEEVDWELEWERVRTLPRVRLIPPEDEGDPVTLYPIPHPRLPLPFLEGAFSQPSLLNSSLAASLISHASLPSPTSESQPPSASMTNRWGTSAVPTGTEHHWKSMAEGFVLPPPMFSRHGLPAPGKRVVMPKTKRQVEADLSRRISMVMTHERNRGSLEVKRQDIMFIQHALEEGRPASPPPLGHTSTNSPILFSPTDIPTRPTTPTPTSPVGREGEGREESPPWDEEGVLGIDAFPPVDTRCALSALADHPSLLEGSEETVDAAEAAIEQDGVDLHQSARESHQDAPIQQSREMESTEAGGVPSSTPLTSPKASTTMERQDSDDQQPSRKKRSKSLTSAFAWPLKSISTNTPPVPDLPPAPKTIKKQKSLKQLFFPDEPPPPLPPMPRDSESSARPLPPPGATPAQVSGRKAKTLLSKASKPALKIETKIPTAKDDEATVTVMSVPSARGGPYPPTPKSPSTAESGAGGEGRPGLIKRFSLSNLSSSFRRKSSVATLSDMGIPTPAEPLPQVPSLPEHFKSSKKGRSTSTPPGAVMTSPVPSASDEKSQSVPNEAKEVDLPPLPPFVSADVVSAPRRKSDELIIDLRHFSKAVYRRSSEPAPEPMRNEAHNALPAPSKAGPPELVIDLRQSSRSPPLYRPPSAPLPDLMLSSPSPPLADQRRGALLPAALITERSPSLNIPAISPFTPVSPSLIDSPPLLPEVSDERVLDDDESVAMSIDSDEGELWIMEATYTHLQHSSPRTTLPSEMSISRFLRNPSVPFESPWDRHIPSSAAAFIPLPVSPASSPTILYSSSPILRTSSPLAMMHRADFAVLDEGRTSIDSTASASSTSTSSREDPTPTTPSILGLSNVPPLPSVSSPSRITHSLALLERVSTNGGDSIVIVSPVTSPIKSPSAGKSRTPSPRTALARFSPEVLTRWAKVGSRKSSPRSVPLPATPDDQHPIWEDAPATGGSLQSEVQLSSLHFEELGLDFQIPGEDEQDSLVPC